MPRATKIVVLTAAILLGAGAASLAEETGEGEFGGECVMGSRSARTSRPIAR